ncbi:MAG: HAD family hydrolase [Clostridiales bacterium]|nr:HAD family hydrolase [Clostridiales bacterium]
MKKAVLFDMDGTLTNTSVDIWENVNLTLKKFGYPEITLEEAIAFVGNGAVRLIQRSLKGQNPDNLQEIVDFYNNSYNFCGSPKTFVYDGLIDLLKKLKSEGYKLAVISNKPQAGTDEVCKKFFAEIEFDYIFGQREGIKVKPDRACVDYTLNALGVTGDEAIFVGDSDVDTKTAINAGVDGICVLWGYRSKQTLIEVGATEFVATADELYKKIKAL